MFILDGLLARSLFNGDVSIGVDCSDFSGRFRDCVAVGVEDDFRSTLTKLDDVTVTLGNKGMILAGLSFRDGAEAVVDVVEDVGTDVDFSTCCGATD